LLYEKQIGYVGTAGTDPYSMVTTVRRRTVTDLLNEGKTYYEAVRMDASSLLLINIL